MKLASETIDGVDVVEIPVQALDADTAREFRRHMEERTRDGGRLVLDLCQVEFVDSSGLGAILSCLRQLNAKGGDLKLCGLSAAVRAMFELVRMHRVMEIHPSREAAVASFSCGERTADGGQPRGGRA